jgi:hypothetical protein
MWKPAVVDNMRYYPGIYLERVNKSRETSLGIASLLVEI